MFFDARLGSCPKGKTCYEYAADFGNNYSALICKNDMRNGSLYVWEDEEFIESNVKTFNKGSNPFVSVKVIDNDGLVTYETVSSSAENSAYKGCYEKTIDINGKTVYVMKRISTIDSSSACPDGTLKGYNNSKGFGGYACLLKEKSSLFYWNNSCSDPDAIVMQDKDKSEPYCAVYKKSYYNANSEKYCPNGGKLNDQTCVINYTKPAIKK